MAVCPGEDSFLMRHPGVLLVAIVAAIVGIGMLLHGFAKSAMAVPVGTRATASAAGAVEEIERLPLHWPDGV